MIRVLQLIQTRADLQTKRTADLLLRECGSGFDVRQITFGGASKCAAPMSLARLLRREKNVDVIHAFGTVAISTAALALTSPMLGTLDSITGMRALRWLRSIAGYRPLHVVASAALQHRAAVLSGIPIDRCHLVRPGLEFSRVQKRHGLELRTALGLDVDDVVLLAPGESTRAAGHDRAAWITSILHVLNPRYKLLLWGRGPQVDAVANLSRRLHQPGLITVATRRLAEPVEFESLTAASDLALVTPTGSTSTLPILTCMAASMPIVAVTTLATAELLEDRHTAWMTTTDLPRELARRVLDVRADPSAAWAYGDRARSEVFDYFTASRLLGEYRPLLARVAASGRSSEPLHPQQSADVYEPGVV